MLSNQQQLSKAKIFLTVAMLLLLPFRSFSQRAEYITEIEDYFRRLPYEGLVFSVHGTNYSPAEYAQYFSESVDRLFAIPYENWRLIRCEHYYKSDWVFRNIIDRINELGTTKSSYFSPQTRVVQRSIMSVKNLGERAYASGYFGEHFSLLSNDSGFLNDMASAFRDNELLRQVRQNFAVPKSHTKYEFAEALEASGDYALERVDNVAVMYFYLNAMTGYNSIGAISRVGDINEKMGDMYLTRDESSSYQKSNIAFRKCC